MKKLLFFEIFIRYNQQKNKQKFALDNYYHDWISPTPIMINNSEMSFMHNKYIGWYYVAQ